MARLFAGDLSGHLWEINPANPDDTTSPYGDLGASVASAINGLTVHDGSLYAVRSGQVTNDFYHINPDDPDDASGDFGLVGTLPAGLTSPFGMTSHEGNLYVVDNIGIELFQINPANPSDTTSPYGEVGGAGNGSLPSGLTQPQGMTSHEGNLYVVDLIGDELFQINPANPSDTTSPYGEVGGAGNGSLPAGLTSPFGMTSHEGNLYVVDNSGDELYQINPANPSDTTSPYGEVGGANNGTLPSGLTLPTALASLPDPAVAPSFTDSTGDTQTWTVNSAITNITVPAAAGNPTPTYATQGSLPSGIAFNTSTRVISGTPTTVGSGTIRIRATNSEGTADWTVAYTTSAALAAPSFSDPTGDAQTWTVNSAITSITVPAASGNPTPTYAVQGSLPSGIAFNTSTRVISGTPTAVGGGTIRIRATNSEGTADWTVAYTTTAALTIPSFSDSTGDAQTWTVGSAITSITVPTASGNPTPTYAVQSGLPSGLAFNTSTRIISGTPTAAGSGTIRIRASNSAGTADWTVGYTTSAALAAPSFSDDTGNAQTWTVGTAITSITVPVASGNPTPSYAVQSGLPAGLAFNTSTRVISGTPTATGSGTIRIRATNSQGTADWTVAYTTSAGLTAPSFTDSTGDAQTWTQDETIASITVPTAAGNPTPTYAAQGSLPSGIAFNTSTRVISGTPTADGSGTIRIRATNSQGTADWTVAYTTSAGPVPPSFSVPPGDARTWTVGTAITPITVPESEGDPTPTYAVFGSLPAGLAFNTSTRVISGTPTAAGSGTIRIRATNSEGTADWTVAYTITAFAPSKPAVPSLTVLNKNRIQAVGIAPNDGGQPITSYDWQYRVVHASTWIDRSDQTSLTQTFSGLTASTTYEFQFRATNTIGDSAYSSPTATAMTPANQAPNVTINTGNMTIAGGATVSLDGTVTDADDATSTLLIAWTSNGGTFVDASLVDTDWTAPARTTQPQTITLTLSATDPDTGFDSATVVMTIPPNIALTGTVTAGSSLLTGALTVIAQVVLAGALTAASPTLAGALTVTPQVVLNGTITSGSPVLTGTLSVVPSAQVDLAGTLTSGSPTLAGALTVTPPGDINLNGVLTAGSPTLAGALTVIPPNDVDLVGTLTAGSPTIAGALTVTAPADVDLSGTITSGNPTLTSALTVTPQVVLNGTITSGSPALTGTLSVVPPADVDLVGTITSGNPTLTGALRVDSLTFADYVVGAGFIVEGAGLIEIGAGTTFFAIPPRGTAGTLLNTVNSFAIGPAIDRAPWTRVQYNSDTNRFVFNDDGPLGLSQYFGVGGDGRVLIVDMQSQSDEGSFAISDPGIIDAIGGNFLRLVAPFVLASWLDNLVEGDRLIISFKRAIPTIALTGTATSGSPTLTGTLSVVPPADVDLVGTITSGMPTLAGALTVTPPSDVDLVGTLTAGSPTIAGALTVTPPADVDLSGTITAGNSILAGTLSVSPRVVLDGVLTAGSPTLASALTVVQPADVNLDGTLTAGMPTIAGTLTVIPAVDLVGTITAGSPTVAGTLSVTPPSDVDLAGAITSGMPALAAVLTVALAGDVPLSGGLTSGDPTLTGALSVIQPSAVVLSGVLTSGSPTLAGALTVVLPADIDDLVGTITAGMPALTGALTVALPANVDDLIGTITAGAPALAGVLTVTPPGTVALVGTITSGMPALTGSLTVIPPSAVDLVGTVTSGDPALAGVLSVTPPSDVVLSGVLTAGMPTLAGALTVVPPADVDDLVGMITSGAPALASVLTVTPPGAVALSGVLTSGAPTLAGALTVTPQVVLNGTITSGSPALTGTLSVVPPADVDLAGTLTSGSPTLAAILTVALPGNVALSGVLTSGDPTLTSTLTVAQPSDVDLVGTVTSGAPALTGVLTVTPPGAVALSGVLTSSSPTLAGALTVVPPADVDDLVGTITSGAPTLTGALTVAQSSDVDDLAGTITSGMPTLMGDLTVVMPPNDVNLVGTLTSGAPALAGALTLTPAIASWTAIIGRPGSQGPTVLLWSPSGPNRRGPINPALVDGGGVAYLGRLRLRNTAPASILLRTASNLTDSDFVAGPDLTHAWESYGSFVLAAGSVSFTFTVTDATSTDPTEPYTWQISDPTAMQAFITAYRTLPSSVQNTTTITLDDNQSPPDTPAVPTLTVLSAISIQAVGIAPDDGGQPILSYDWQYRVVGASVWIDRLNQASLTQTFSSLTASTNYEFQFRASNTLGDSAYSFPTATAMTPPPPPDVDLDGTITAGSPTLASVLTVALPGDVAFSGRLTSGSPTLAGALSIGPRIVLDGTITAGSPTLASVLTVALPGDVAFSGRLTSGSPTLAGTLSVVQPGAVALVGRITSGLPALTGTLAITLPMNVNDLDGTITAGNPTLTGLLSVISPIGTNFGGIITSGDPILAGVLTILNPGNLPPVVSVSADVGIVSGGGTVTLTTVATDPEGNPLAYQWVSSVEGAFSDDQIASPTWMPLTAARPKVGYLTVEVGASGGPSTRVTRRVFVRRGFVPPPPITTLISSLLGASARLPRVTDGIDLPSHLDLMVSQWDDATRLRALIANKLDLKNDFLVRPLAYLELQRSINSAEGVFLDHIGDLLGLPRPRIATTTFEQFGFATDTTGFEQGPFASSNPFLIETVAVSDQYYRPMVRARGLTVRSGTTLPEIQAVVELLFDEGTAVIEDNVDLTMTLTVEEPRSQYLQIVRDTNQIPHPAGVTLIVVVI